MSSQSSDWSETLEGVRSRYPLLLNWRTKCRARRHQGHVNLRCALVQFPSERTCLSTQGNAEVFALERLFTHRKPLLLQELRIEWDNVCRRLQPDPRRIIAIPGHPKWIGAAPGGGQHRKARFWSTGAHRPQSCDQFIGEPCRLIRHNPTVHGQSAYGIVAAWQRQHA